MPNYVVHEQPPLLCKEVNQYLSGEPYEWSSLEMKFKEYHEKHRSHDLVCECAHRLGYFCKELDGEFPKAKFIWLIRNPIKTLISLVANYSHWKPIKDRYPSFFQKKIEEGIGGEFNQWRPTPPNWEMELHEMYLWEWLTTYKEVRSQLSSIPAERRMILATEDITANYTKIFEFLGRHLFRNNSNVANWANMKADSVFDRGNGKAITYAQKLIWSNQNPITKQIISELSKLPKTDPTLVEADRKVLRHLEVSLL